MYICSSIPPPHHPCACLLSCILLSATPRTAAHQVPLFMGFPRLEYWSRLPFPLNILQETKDFVLLTTVFLAPRTAPGILQTEPKPTAFLIKPKRQSLMSGTRDEIKSQNTMCCLFTPQKIIVIKKNKEDVLQMYFCK